MARMIGKANKRKGCPYKCCDPDFANGRKNRRRVQHMWRARENRRWRREAQRELTE